MSNQIMNCLCVLSAYNRLRHVQKNQFPISAIGPEALSSYCLMKYTPSKGSHIFHQGETVVQENEKKLSLIIGKLCLQKRWPHCTVYSTACSVMKAQKKKKTHLRYKMFNKSDA